MKEELTRKATIEGVRLLWPVAPADNSAEATIRKGIRLSSQLPIIVASHQRLREGKALIAPNQTLGHAANFLAMLSGDPPSEGAARLMDLDFILHAEHGSRFRFCALGFLSR